MAVGSHTGAWSRALDECGDDTGELTEAFVRVAQREMLDLAGPLSDLGHVNEVTLALWSRRLQFVFDHPLGKQSRSAIGPRYDVPAEFLRELGSTAFLQYVDKLVEIGSDDGQLVLNRAVALAAAANVVDLLSTSDRDQVFRRVRPLAEQPIQISEMDEYHTSTQHPLSRFRMSLGSETDVRTSAGWLLGRAATSRDECTAVMEIALDWVRSGDSVLQDEGASILTLPNVSPLRLSKYRTGQAQKSIRAARGSMDARHATVSRNSDVRAIGSRPGPEGADSSHSGSPIYRMYGLRFVWTHSKAPE